MSLGYLKSSLGKKAVMAVTGVLLSLFLLAHLLGNLQIFLGPEALNSYGEHLEELEFLLWPARAALLLTILLHIKTAVQLALENRAARPVPYGFQNTVQASYASRTMVFSGFIILAYIIFHLLHFTFGVIHPEFCQLHDSKGREDIYSMVILSFRDWKISLSYLAAMAVLTVHLSHGFASLFQSLGMSNDAWRRKLKLAGATAAGIFFVGYASIPVASYLGWIKPLQGNF